MIDTELRLVGVAEVEGEAGQVDVGVDQHALRRLVHPIALKHPLRPDPHIAAKEALKRPGDHSVPGGQLGDGRVVNRAEHAVDHLLHELRSGVERAQALAQERLHRSYSVGDVIAAEDGALQLAGRRPQ
jgi:hypothetical protein